MSGKFSLGKLPSPGKLLSSKFSKLTLGELLANFPANEILAYALKIYAA